MGRTSQSKSKSTSQNLEIDDDLQFQRKMWRFERIGWCGIAAILAAAALGLFGRGPLSRATLPLTEEAKATAGMMVEYERLARASSETRLVITGVPVVRHGRFSLWVSGEYLNDVEVQRITPEPAAQDLVSNGVRFQFDAEDGPQTVTFRVKPERPGILSGTLRLSDGFPTTFSQWVFP